MEEVKKGVSHATSAAAFVEGGIQDASDDACSICLETFSKSDPSTSTHCKHDFHLQCILEWCQRSSNCPMCWRQISLEEPESQELLKAVEQERSIQINPGRTASIIHHPALGNIEFPHLPTGISNTELEERIIQHLAAAMGRANHIARRERSRRHPSSNERPMYSLFSTHPNATRVGPSSSSVPMISNSQGISVGSSSSGKSFMTDQESAGPSDFQSFSDTLRSRFGAMSMKYRESFSKTKRGWKERLFSRSTSLSDIGNMGAQNEAPSNNSSDSLAPRSP